MMTYQNGTRPEEYFNRYNLKNCSSLIQEEIKEYVRICIEDERNRIYAKLYGDDDLCTECFVKVEKVLKRRE